MRKHLLHDISRALAAALALGTSCAWSAATFVPGSQPLGDVPQLALTGFNLSTGTQKAFQVFFDPNSWVGDVSAFPVGTDGKTQISAKIWSANAQYAAHQACYSTDPAPASVDYWNLDRLVVTRDATGTNIPFRWANLSSSQKSSIDADTADGGKGDLIHRFIRGDRANEIYKVSLDGAGAILAECGVKSPGTGTFRSRLSILGDVLHARPVYVGAPPADYTFDSYQTFKTAQASRPTRLYVGANDGMVRALDATDGGEVWSYIPSMLIGTLKALSVEPYSHTYYLDGQMTAGDVNFGTTAAPDWRTVIVGGLGAGGKGLFALDVTNADAADETAAKAKILWEITPASTNFGSLGYTYGTPVIARMNTGQWVVIVGNGYLNTGTGTAVLYIIDIKTGTKIAALDTGSGTLASPNGLSTPTAIDTTFDGKIDRIYAGDIDGNMWKFDVSATTASSWTAPTSAFFPTSTDISNGIARKAILGAPDVAAHPISGYLVYFATGRLLTGGTSSDADDSTVVNYAYGIWDGAPGTNTTLQNQTLTEKAYGSQRVRVSSGLAINWNVSTDPVNNPMRKGWATALPAGERSIGTGFVRDARFQFTGVNPTITNAALPNGENWLIELDYLTGGATDKPIFDLNQDSLLSDADRVNNAAGTAPQTGTTGIPVAVYMGAGLLSQPVLANVSAQLSTTLFNDNPYSSPGDQPAFPPPPPPDRGVAGGHFDVEIYYPYATTTSSSTAGKMCKYASTATPATGSSFAIDFTYSSNRTADPLSIKVAGVEILTQNNPGSRSRSSLETWISGKLTSAFTNDWTAVVGSGKITFTNKTTGPSTNNTTVAMTTGSGVTTSHYNYNTTSSGGADAVPGVDVLSSCRRNLHYHEYDEVFNVTGVNMLNASDPLLNIDKGITDTTTNFKLLVSNQYLSPAVTLSIGGAPHVSVKEFTATSTLSLASLPTYNRGNIGTFAYNMPVDAFSFKDWWTGNPAAVCATSYPDPDCRAGLHPTPYSCVTIASDVQGGSMFFPVIPPSPLGTNGPGTSGIGSNSSAPYVPGASTGVRHNGSLTFQLVKDTTPDSAIEMSIPGQPEYGWRVKDAFFETYVLMQWTTFWHHPTSVCYHQSGWTKFAAPDTSAADSSVFKTPAAGSADPGYGTARVTVTSTSTTTTTSGGTTTTAVTTNYSNGSKVIVTTVTTGGVSTTTSQYVPPSSSAGGSGSGSTGGSASGVGQAVSSPNTITGYQQTRNSGKLGRVTWHELFRQ